MAFSSKLLQVPSWLAGPVLAASLLAIVCLSRRESRGPADPPLDGWDIRELVAHLRTAGLALRVVPTQKDEVVSHNAYLTTTDQRWEEFNRLPKSCDLIDSWRGTVYVEKGPADADQSDRMQLWGDCCLAAGPFLFFGDPELLARIRSALAGLGQAEVDRR
jgi:hypothetical protein